MSLTRPLSLTRLLIINKMTHKNLDVYKSAMSFITDIYKITTGFPEVERYGLANQMRRSAVSIASNIAEGAARNSTKEYIQFLHHALGSATELETQLQISINLGYLDEKTNLPDQLYKIIKMLIGLIQSLKKKI